MWRVINSVAEPEFTVWHLPGKAFTIYSNVHHLNNVPPVFCQMIFFLIADCKMEDGVNRLKFWEELTCGIYRMTIDASDVDGLLVGVIKRYEWRNTVLKELIQWERVHVVPNDDDLNLLHKNKKDCDAQAFAVIPSNSGLKQLQIC